MTTAEKYEIEAYKHSIHSDTVEIIKHIEFAKRRLATLYGAMNLYENGSPEEKSIGEIRGDVEKIQKEMTSILNWIDGRMISNPSKTEGEE